MQMRRRFQPMVDGLPYRIAPSSVAVVAPPAIAAPPGAGVPVDELHLMRIRRKQVSATPIILAPPPTGGDGTIVC